MRSPEGYHGDILLKRIPDSEGDDNRGWRVDVIAVEVDGQPAGYIGASYIPQERFHTWYPNGIWNWLRLVNGYTSLPIDPAAPNARETLSLYSRRLPEPDDRTKDPKKQIIKQVESAYPRYPEFIASHVDRPIVDFIRVYQGEGQFVDWSQGKREWIRTSNRTDFSRCGLGTLLYLEMARWLSESGLRLHASGCQTPPAEAAWSRMADRWPAAVMMEYSSIRKKYDKILEVSGLPVWLPDWAQSATMVLASGHKAILKKPSVQIATHPTM
jgi:hypothetical protein